MYPSETEILFPFHISASLAGLRGSGWKRIVLQACHAPVDSPEQLAFSLMMIRMCGCLTCHTNSYRALRGCSKCAQQAIRRFKGEDEDLATLYRETILEVQERLRQEQ